MLVLDFVGRHGLAVYIICVLIFFVVSGLAQRVSQGSDTPLPKFKTWFLMQLATLFLFGAFAGLVGHVPWPLILASLGVSFGGFLIIKLLASLAGSALEISSRDIKKLQAVVFAEHVIVMSILGFGFIASLVVNISLLIWSGFAYDPALTASPLYQAKIAFYILILPNAIILLLATPVNIFFILSKYSTPAFRNISFINATLSPLTNSVYIFGPYYVYQGGFDELGIALPSMSITTFVIIASAAFLILLVLPYVIGQVRHARFARELSQKRLELLSRALTISDWPEDSAYRAKKTDELCDNIVSEFGRLGGNLLLRYFAIRLLTLLLHSDATGSGQALRERVFERLGFGASPLERLEAAAQQIKDLPAFQRPPFTIYIADVEEDAHGLPAGHPLESHFLRLTLVLAELMNLNPDFKYMCSDWLSEEKKVEKNVVREAKPAMAFTALSTAAPILGRVFEADLRIAVTGTARVLQNFWVVLFGAT